MKILVSGGSGFVGYWMCERFARAGHEVEYTFLSNACEVPMSKGHRVDITDKEGVLALAKNKYDAIVHSAALTKVDFCEEKPEIAYKHNVEGTGNFLELAKKTNAKFAYVSTSHVFPASERAYAESDEAKVENAPNEYGRTKLEGENLVRKSGLEHAILRIDQPYYWNQEWQKENTVTRTLKKLGKKEKVREVSDWMNCPTFVPSFCELARVLLEGNASGVFHAAGPDYVSRVQWARAVAREFGYEEGGIGEMGSESLHLPAARPNVRLDSSRAYANAKVKNLGIEEALRSMRKEKESMQ